jgi:hypothetical protein
LLLGRSAANALRIAAQSATLPVDCRPIVAARLGKGAGAVRENAAGVRLPRLDGRSWAVNDVTIGDSMFPSSHDWERWYGPRGLLPNEGPTTMRSLAEILADGRAPTS